MTTMTPSTPVTVDKPPFCSQCGHLSVRDQKFCSQCGAALQATAQQAALLASATSGELASAPVPMTSVHTPGINQTVTVNVTQAPPVMPVIIDAGGGSNLFVRAIYFLCFGWWFGAIVSGVAWVLLLTIIGLPLGLWLINRLPAVITMRPQEQRWQMDGNVLRRGQAQYPFLLRAGWFVVFGWWLSGLWMLTAYAALISVVMIPVSFWMYNRVGAVTTLYRS